MHEASGSPANSLVRPHDRIFGTHSVAVSPRRLRPDGDCLDIFLRSDNMFHRRAKFHCKLPMGDQHQSNHARCPANAGSVGYCGTEMNGTVYDERK